MMKNNQHANKGKPANAKKLVATINNPTAGLQIKFTDSIKNAKANTKAVKEIGGVDGPQPTRYGDWVVNGRCTDF